MHTPTFTCLVTCVSTPTAPDVSFPPNVITETWAGLTLTVTLDPGDKPTDDYRWTDNITDEELHVEDFLSFVIVDTTNNVQSGNSIFLGPQPKHFTDTGLLSFSSMPEPSSLALMLLGIGLVFLVGKRVGPGLSRAS